VSVCVQINTHLIHTKGEGVMWVTKRPCSLLSSALLNSWLSHTTWKPATRTPDLWPGPAWHSAHPHPEPLPSQLFSYGLCLFCSKLDFLIVDLTFPSFGPLAFSKPKPGTVLPASYWPTDSCMVIIYPSDGHLCTSAKPWEHIGEWPIWSQPSCCFLAAREREQ
jgi:hypothetical protein